MRCDRRKRRCADINRSAGAIRQRDQRRSHAVWRDERGRRLDPAARVVCSVRDARRVYEGGIHVADVHIRQGG